MIKGKFKAQILPCNQRSDPNRRPRNGIEEAQARKLSEHRQG